MEGSISRAPRSQLSTYAHDRSVYFIRPPKGFFSANEKEVIQLVRDTQREKIPITARGGGTGLSGATVGSGWVVELHTRIRYTKKLIQEIEHINYQICDNLESKNTGSGFQPTRQNRYGNYNI